MGGRTCQGRTGDPDGVSRTLTSYGLATVDEDVVLRLSLEHEDFSQLKIEVLNPLGDEGDPVVVFDGSNPTHTGKLGADSGFVRPELVVFTSGDEDVNGDWTLRVTDATPGGDAGHVLDWSLTISSRFD